MRERVRERVCVYVCRFQGVLPEDQDWIVFVTECLMCANSPDSGLPNAHTRGGFFLYLPLSSEYGTCKTVTARFLP